MEPIQSGADGSYFDGQNSISQDRCTLGLRDRGNTSAAAYTLTNLRDHCPDERGQGVGETHPLAIAARHRNLRVWDGYGVNTRAVAVDSAFTRDTDLTRPRQRTQLPKRVFTAAPDLSHGVPAPDVEARIMAGVSSTAALRACAQQVTERDFDRFDPGVRTVDAKHIIPTWQRGGAPSRDIARSEPFLRSIGAFGRS